jgi:hypothetical protein
MSKRKDGPVACHPRSAGTYRRASELCTFPATDCEAVALADSPYCDTHHARLAAVAAEFKKWGPKPPETTRRRLT